jgi:hypothetical protein
VLPYDPVLAARVNSAAHRPAGNLLISVTVAAQSGTLHASAAGSFPLAPITLAVKAHLKKLALGQVETLSISYFANAPVSATVVGADGHVYRLSTRTNAAGTATARFTITTYNPVAAALAARHSHGVLAVRVTVQAQLGATKAGTTLTLGWTAPALLKVKPGSSAAQHKAACKKAPSSAHSTC